MGAVILPQPSPRAPKGEPSHLDSESTFNKFQYCDLPLYASKECAILSLSHFPPLSLLFSLHPPSSPPHPSFSLPPHRARAFSCLTRIAINPPFERKRLAMPPEKSCALQLPVLAWRGSHEKTRDIPSDTRRRHPPVLCMHLCASRHG